MVGEGALAGRAALPAVAPLVAAGVAEARRSPPTPPLPRLPGVSSPWALHAFTMSFAFSLEEGAAVTLSLDLRARTTWDWWLGLGLGLVWGQGEGLGEGYGSPGRAGWPRCRGLGSRTT